MSFFVLTLTEASLDWLPSFVAGVPLCATRTSGCHSRRQGRRFRLDDVGEPGLDSRRRHANPGWGATSPISTKLLLSMQLSSGLAGRRAAVRDDFEGPTLRFCAIALILRRARVGRVHRRVAVGKCRKSVIQRLGEGREESRRVTIVSPRQAGPVVQWLWSLSNL